MSKERKSHLTFEYMSEFAKEHDFELLNTYEKDNKKYVSVKCKNGHIHDLTWVCFRNKHGCKECNRKYTKDYIINYANKFGYKVKSFDGYTDLNFQLTFICSNNHLLKTSFANFMNGRRCPICEGGKNFYTQEELEEIFKSEGCELLSTFKVQKDMVNFKCSCGNYASIRIDHFLNGVRCDECAKEKRRITMYQDGTAPCSIQQRYLHKLFGGELNYPISRCSLDIAFPEDKIYIEYNGGGHNLQVQFGNMSELDFLEYENKRFLFLKSQGYKCIYILTNKDKLPSDTVLLNMLEYAKSKLLDDIFYIKFDIDNSKIIISQFEEIYDYGNLRKISKDMLI